jgi:hypothetical protein
MLSNYESETEVFVTYPIKPIKFEFEDSLYKHLLQNVWGDRREVEEDIRVGDYRYGKPNALDVVRYQFGDRYQAEEYCDEIAELINKHIEQWVCKNGGYEIVGA